MLELFILQWLMTREGESQQTSGHLIGHSVSYIQKRYSVPKGTFYRAVNRLLDNGMIVKQQRNQYVCSHGFRVLSNGMKDARTCVAVWEGGQR